MQYVKKFVFWYVKTKFTLIDFRGLERTETLASPQYHLIQFPSNGQTFVAIEPITKKPLQHQNQ